MLAKKQMALNFFNDTLKWKCPLNNSVFVLKFIRKLYALNALIKNNKF